MNLSEQSHSNIISALREALAVYAADGERSVITDIHLQPKQDSGELAIFDDDDKELSRTIVDEWVEYDSDDFYTEIEPLLRADVASAMKKVAPSELCLMKPYSFVLVDDDKETIAELLLMDDDDTLLLDGELLKGLDDELNDFLKELLES